MSVETNPPAIVRGAIDEKALKKQAEAAHQQVQQADADSAEAKRAAGAILVEIKKQVQAAGLNFKDWATKNFSFSYRTAARYMRINKHWDKIKEKVTGLSPGEDQFAILSSGAALRLISKKGDGKDGRSRKRTYKVPSKLKPYADTIKELNKDLGIKAPPEAIFTLLTKLGFSEADIEKQLKAMK
jgi:hypothetical protein